MTQVILFYFYAGIAVVGAIGLVTAPRLVHAVMWLLATLAAIAALILLMGSEFLAAMQLFIYGGAVTVLVLFVLMLTRHGSEQQIEEESGASRKSTRWLAAATSVALFTILVPVLMGARGTPTPASPSIATLASTLFTSYVVPFEIAGLVLTIALIGAIVLAREDDDPPALAPDPLDAEGSGDPAVTGSSAADRFGESGTR